MVETPANTTKLRHAVIQTKPRTGPSTMLAIPLHWRRPVQFGFERQVHIVKFQLRSRFVGLTSSNGYNRRLLISGDERFMRFHFLTPLLLLTTGVLLADGDPAAGKEKAYTCTGCHGIPGYSNAYPNYKVPKVGGQNYEYLISALKSYRDGQRKHPTMQLQASSLSDQDIMDVSAYFAGRSKDQ